METNKEIWETPFAATHPTEIIKEECKARGMSRKELADRMGMQPSNLSRFLKGESITAATAAKLEDALGIPANIWLNMQAQYNKDVESIEKRDDAEREAINIERMLSTIFNLPEMYKRLSISASSFISDKLKKLSEYLGFDAVEMSKMPFALNANMKENEKLNIDEKNHTTWLALAYIEARKNRPTGRFEISNIQGAAKQIAQLAHKGLLKESDIRQILNANGIRYCVVKKLEKTPIDAAAMIVEDCPAVITTHRYDDMAKLVFNVLHELGHIQKHLYSNIGTVYVSSEYTYSRENKEEREANEFAEDTLIPKNLWEKVMKIGSRSLYNYSICRILKHQAEKYGLNADIVIGRYKYEFGNYRIGGKAQPIR